MQCFGVGGIRIEAKQEWIVKLKRKDGNYQLVQGLTMENVCAQMPVVNTSQALHDLKQSDPDNDLLQSCCVPPEVGGTVDIILGIRYNNIAPKVIHTLESGLTIYSISLETHDPLVNAAIGGPHRSFSSIVNYHGGLSRVSQSLQTLYIQLENFKRYGPPSIPVMPLNENELHLRQFYVEKEFGFCPQTQVKELELDFIPVASEKFSHEEANPLSVLSHSCCQSSCHYSEEDGLRDLKYWYRQMEGGTTVDYRCPNCRECIKCKNSDNTDKISLREEIEQKAVEDSVHFDRENK